MLQVGMKVYFGRDDGEKTLGEIVKLNRVKAKVKTLETRGSGRGSGVGTIWGVPYTMITPADSQNTFTPKEKLRYNPDNKIENLIIEAIMLCQAQLEPDNLVSDNDRVVLQRQLNGLNKAFGRELDITEIIDWSISRVCNDDRVKTA